MESSARVWIEVLRGSQRRLAGLTSSLSPEQLRGQSYATEWSVAQVLSHLGSQAEISQRSLDAALAGQPMPGVPEFQEIWAVWDARDPDEQAAALLAADDAQVTRMEGLSDEELASIDTELFGLPIDAVGLVWLRLGEHAVHTWDVAVSFDPAATVDAAAVPLLLEFAPRIAGFAQPVGDPWRVLIETTAPDRRFLLDVGEKVTLTPVPDGAGPDDTVPDDTVPDDTVPDGPADARVRMPAEALLRLIYGRLDPDHTPPVEVTEGGDDVLDRLRRLFPGF